MNRKYIIKEKELFNNIIKKGKYIKNKYFVIYIMKSEFSYPRFGFAVGKKIGNAVCRNKLKRQLRDIVRNNIDLFIKNNDYIILPKSCCNELKYDRIKEELVNLIRKGEKNA